ncbi:MAG: hypothetical protein V1725_00970 [archaeon]
MNKLLGIGLAGTTALLIAASIPQKEIPEQIRQTPALSRLDKPFTPIMQAIDHLSGLPYGRADWEETNVYFQDRQWKSYFIFDIAKNRHNDTLITSGAKIEMDCDTALKSLLIRAGCYQETKKDTQYVEHDFYLRTDTDSLGRITSIDCSTYQIAQDSNEQVITSNITITPVYDGEQLTKMVMCAYLDKDSTCEKKDTLAMSSNAFTISPLPFVFNDDGSAPQVVQLSCPQSAHILALPKALFNDHTELVDLYKHLPQ